MAAVFAAAAEAPITAIMIVFEMSSDYTIILPLMVTVVIALFSGDVSLVRRFTSVSSCGAVLIGSRHAIRVSLRVSPFRASVAFPHSSHRWVSRSQV